MREENFCPKCGCDVFECSGAIVSRCSNREVKSYCVNTYTVPMFAGDTGERTHIEQAYTAEDAAYQVSVKAGANSNFRRVTAVYPYKGPK